MIVANDNGQTIVTINNNIIVIRDNNEIDNAQGIVLGLSSLF